MKTKILVVGSFNDEMQEKALSVAFEEIGCEVTRFGWGVYFKGYLTRPPKNIIDFIPWFVYRFENKFRIGPIFRKINKDLLECAEKSKPDLVFAYRCTHILGKTIKAIKERTGAVIFSYNNDDPFGNNYPKYFWQNYLDQTPYYDHIFVFRKKNADDYLRILGRKDVSVMLPDYIEKMNFPIEELQKNKYSCDISFIGHYEKDGRDEYIKELVDSGLDFKLFGPLWELSPYYEFYKDHLGKIETVPFSEYNLALNSPKIALVFLSHLNNDVYTRRCFEIPAAGTFMLSVYTKELDEMFKEGIEAEYFRNKKEMIDKINYYLLHDDERIKIATAGRERLLRDGHETKDRARQIIELYKEYEK